MTETFQTRPNLRFEYHSVNCINPYYTTISYPYVGTLNTGIHVIDGDRVESVQIIVSDSLTELKDIRKLVYNQSYLACQTNNSVTLYTETDIKGQLKHEKKEIPTFTKPILDIALTQDSLYILAQNSLVSLALKDEGKQFRSNPGYTALAVIDNGLVPYSDMSVVNGYVLVPDPVDWWKILSGLILTALLIVLAVKQIELQSRRKNPEYHSTKDLIDKLTKSNLCKSFLEAQIPQGYPGELHRQMDQLLQTVISASIDNTDEMITAKRQVVELSNIIFGRYKELRSHLLECKNTVGDKVDVTNSVDFKDDAKAFIDNLYSILTHVELSNKKDTDLILTALSIILSLEKIYAEINNALEVNQLRKYAQEFIIDNEPENGEELADLLIRDRALLSTLILKITGKTRLFFDESDLMGFGYMWDGFLLLSLTDIDKDKIKKYLKETFYPSNENSDKKTEKEKTNKSNENWKQLWNKSHNVIISFFRTRCPQNVWERQDFIPTLPLDLALISSIRFYDRKAQSAEKDDE